MNDAEILTLVDRLEHCQFAPSEFHHRDHLAVTVAYLYSADFETALSRLRESLMRFISFHGVMGYNETLTRFWVEQVEKRLDRKLCLEHSVRQIQAELGDKTLIFTYYTRERLNSAEAKQRWVEPDLAPIA
jgi:hypothetical protein